jgi:hypothetical protein
MHMRMKDGRLSVIRKSNVNADLESCCLLTLQIIFKLTRKCAPSVALYRLRVNVTRSELFSSLKIGNLRRLDRSG